MGRHRARHRVPPKPATFATSKPGNCRMCGLPVMEGGKVNRRKRWHDVCIAKWRVMNHPTETRAFLFRRDGGACARCGVYDPLWEADHIVPLRAASAPEHWLPGNLQTLCRAHHLEKTAEDRLLYD